MLLRALTNGKITGTGTITVKSFKIGGVLISTNNTNAAAVILRRNDSNGKRLFDMSSITTIWSAGPFSTEDAETVYYDVSGTGASAQLYEWVD